jgi:hypothetical protein
MAYGDGLIGHAGKKNFSLSVHIENGFFTSFSALIFVMIPVF